MFVEDAARFGYTMPCCIVLGMSAVFVQIARYLSSKRLQSDNPAKSTSRALPASWYRSGKLYELERRAIFSKRWLLVAHRLRLEHIGDWLRLEQAGFAFFLIRDRPDEIRGFHNPCIHRAFPVITGEESGNSKILSCAYHGWSYGLNGKLAKAPGFQDMQNFGPSENGLLPIHVHVDENGFIWVNLDAAKVPEISWAADFEGIDIQSRFKDFDFSGFRFDHTWNMSGDYNWKTLADNYNECYHCATAHPDASAAADLSIYSVDTAAGHIQHFAHTKAEYEKQGIKIASTFYFPNACMTVSFMYMMRCVPTSASHCSMEYDVYRHKDASDEDFERLDSMFKRILNEDKWLCNNAQKNLNAGVFVNGEMHPRLEKGPLFLRDKLRQILTEHRTREEKLGHEIWPAQQKLPGDQRVSKVDDAFCQGLECQSSRNDISW